MAGIALGRFSGPVAARAPGRGWAAAVAAVPDAAGARRAAADAAQAVPACGEHGDRGGRGEHAQGDQPEIPAPARRRAGHRGGRAVSPGPLRIIPPGHLSGEHAVEPLSHAVGHRGRGGRGEQRGDLSQLTAKTGAVITGRQVRRDPGAAAPGDEPGAELGQDFGIWVGHVLVPAALRLAHASPPCAGETLSPADRFPSWASPGGRLPGTPRSPAGAPARRCAR